MKFEKKTGIYKVTNKEDGKIYIGQAKDIEKRWITHKRTKYPEDQFTYEIIMECDLEQLNFWEIAWITSENACDPAVGYNKALGGTSLKSIIPSDEVRAKIGAASKAWVGRKFTDEHKANMAAAAKGKKLTDETRAKLSAANKGKKLTDETRAKLSAASKAWVGRKFTDEHKANMAAAQKGTKKSDETKAKIGAAHKGKKVADETRAKMSAAAKGKMVKHSDETRAKMSAAQKARWSRREIQTLEEEKLKN